MAQKKLPPGVQIVSAPKGAHISSPGKPKPAVKLAPKPVKQPPQIHLETKMRRYQDVPAFGFDIISITIDGKTIEIYRACSFADNGGIPVMILPTHNGFACSTEAEADAYKEHIKQQALKPQLVVPGHPDYKKPPLLH